MTSPTLDEILIYPTSTNKVKKQRGGTSVMPKHLSGDQMLCFLEEREQKKHQEEEKMRRKEEKEIKKKQKEEETVRKRS